MEKRDEDEYDSEEEDEDYAPPGCAAFSVHDMSLVVSSRQSYPAQRLTAQRRKTRAQVTRMMTRGASLPKDVSEKAPLTRRRVE